MNTPPGPAAFRQLARDLHARRVAAIEPAVRVLATVVVLVLMAFVFWQVRVPLSGAAHTRGPLAAAGTLALVLAVLAVAAGAGAHGAARRLARRAPGPEWLALPAQGAVIARHLLAEARRPAWLAFPPGAAALGAGLGIVPPAWLALSAVAFLVAWLECTRLGHALAWRSAPAASWPGGAPTRVVAVLAAGPVAPRGGRARRARWTGRGPASAIAALDRARTRREPAVRRAALAALAFTLGGLAAWALPRPAIERVALAFAGFLLAAAALGGWSAALVGGDPPTLWRPLPLSPRGTWGARLRPLLLAVLAIPVAHAAVAAPLGMPARAGIVIGWPLPALLVATLGLHHALSLYPDARSATRITTTWLATSLAASLMIPLLGWVVLLAGAIHAARRVSRGFHSETR